MLESFLKFLELGLYHIVSFSSHDHILFVVLLALPYAFKDWKRLLILISVFTLGHTLSLLLGVFDIVNLNVNTTEWLIPITIFFAALFNIFSPRKPNDNRSYLMLGIVMFFGLIHGLGFANAFKTLVSINENTFLSVIEFAIGIEI